MNCEEVLSRLLESYKNYYDVSTSDCTQPFCAQAEFHSTNKQYILVKAAKVSESQSNEFVFFSIQKHLTKETLCMLEETAWNEGLKKFTVKAGHRNSDISLIIIAESADKDALARLKKIHHYKSYWLTFRGWSAFSAALFLTQTNTFYSNKFGKSLKKLFPK